MTFCLGIKVESGLIGLADTRLTSGTARVTARKVTIHQHGRHSIFLMTSGLRSARDKAGELDIVAVDGRTIVFVEVKTRTSDVAGRPIEAVDEDKQQRLTRLALRYLKRHDLLEKRWRFDVVAVTWPENRRRPVIEHFENAFQPADVGQMFS